jgi:ABC-type dipeptide/oligopeptide/nickel transport system ATPase component
MDYPRAPEDRTAGEILGIIGPNGAGKTTLMECLVGCCCRQDDDGTVFFTGFEALPVSRRREAMFFLPDGITPWSDQAGLAGHRPVPRTAWVRMAKDRDGRRSSGAWN